MSSVRGPRLLAAAALFVAIFAVYAPAARNGFVYDDTKVVVVQQGLSSVEVLHRIFTKPHFPRFPYYRPITRSSLLLQKAIHGNSPAPFHLVNALLIAMTAWAAYALLRLPAFGIRPVPALLAAGAFALHPIASTCVYPIASGRETLLPALVMLAAVHAYLKPGTRWRLAATGWFVVALFCKEQAAVLPGVFLLADLLGLTADPPGGRLRAWLVRYGPIVVCLAGYLVIRHLVVRHLEVEITPLARGPWAPIWSFVYAAQVIFAPFVEVVYEPTLEVWRSSWRWVVAAALAITLLATARRSAISGPLALFWLGWFVLLQLPTANLLTQEAMVAERYVFLASLAVFAVAAYVLSAHWEGRRVRRWATLLSLLLLAALAVVSLQRARYYRDDTAFATQWLRTNPESYEAHFSLGYVHARDNRLDQARHHYREAVRIKSDFVDARLMLGRVLHRSGEPEAALAELERVLRLRPDDAVAHYSVAKVLADLGRPNDAVFHLERAIAVKPAYRDALIDLGALLGRLGRFDEAEARLTAALELKPDAPQVRRNLAVLRHRQARSMLASGATADALEAFRAALAAKPGWPPAAFDLAWTLATHPSARFRDAEEALRLATDACRAVDIQNPRALDILAATQAATGRFDDAVATAGRAAEMAAAAGNPAFAEEIRRRIELYESGRPYRTEGR